MGVPSSATTEGSLNGLEGFWGFFVLLLSKGPRSCLMHRLLHLHLIEEELVKPRLFEQNQLACP